jgi:hypothetical protein
MHIVEGAQKYQILSRVHGSSSVSLQGVGLHGEVLEELFPQDQRLRNRTPRVVSATQLCFLHGSSSLESHAFPSRFVAWAGYELSCLSSLHGEETGRLD